MTAATGKAALTRMARQALVSYAEWLITLTGRLLKTGTLLSLSLTVRLTWLAFVRQSVCFCR